MRVHRIRQIQGYLGDREMTHKLVNDVAPRYTERNGGYTRILKLGTPRRRQRPDGAHRTRVVDSLVDADVDDSRRVGESTSELPDDADGLRHASARVSSCRTSASDFHGFAASPGVPSVLGELTDAISLVARATGRAGRRRAHRCRRARLGSGGLGRPARSTSTSTTSRGASTRCARRRSRSARRSGPSPDSTPGSRPPGGCYRYHVWNDPAPNPLLASA